MKILERIDEVIYFGSIAFNHNEKGINKRRYQKQNIISSDEYKSQLFEQRKMLSDLISQLKNIKDEYLSSNIKSIVPREYETLVAKYLNLIEFVFYTVIGSPLPYVVTFHSISNIILLSNDIEKASLSVFVENTIPKYIEEDYIPKVVELQALFENDINMYVQIRVDKENRVKIDYELDKIRASLDSKLGEISQQYSDGRTQLLKSAEKHENSVKSLLETGWGNVEKYKQEMDGICSELKDKRVEIADVQTSAEACLQIVRGILKETSQAGMAGAFQERHNSLKVSMIIWFIAFFVSLCGLTFVGVIFVMSAFSSEIKTAVELISKMAITFPLVWGAWFSAKQYSHASQLREDYAYKVAVAMTYHGYKDEAADVNNEMSGKLLDSIIAQFSDNPVRLYKNNDSVSVIEAMLKNDKLSDIIKSTKNGVSGSAK